MVLATAGDETASCATRTAGIVAYSTLTAHHWLNCIVWTWRPLLNVSKCEGHNSCTTGGAFTVPLWPPPRRWSSGCRRCEFLMSFRWLVCILSPPRLACWPAAATEFIIWCRAARRKPQNSRKASWCVCVMRRNLLTVVLARSISRDLASVLNNYVVCRVRRCTTFGVMIWIRSLNTQGESDFDNGN